MNNYELKDAEEDPLVDIDEQSEVIPYRYKITAYGADYPVDGLVSRLQNGDILIPTFDPDVPGKEVEGFQRDFVWTRPQAEKFIESLLLGLPVPGIFLVKQKDDKLLVLDGQQRLRTLQYFFEGVIRGRVFELTEVQEKYVGCTFKTLEDEDRRRLNNSIIHSTIVQEDTPTEALSSIYLIFERLNTGGTKLSPHEIRVALHGGQFARLLRDLEEFEAWQNLAGGKRKRLKGQELILRFFALFYQSSSYSSPMKEFLNGFMASNKQLTTYGEQTLRDLFESTTKAIDQHIGPGAFRFEKAVNAAVLDSIMVGVAKRVTSGKIQCPSTLSKVHKRIIADPEYRDAVEKATARPEQVEQRLAISSRLFGEVM